MPSEPMSVRVGKVFGALGERQKSTNKPIVVAGIHVPPRPEEPTNCCGSGCVDCVWELYREELMEYKSIRNKAAKKLMQPKYHNVKWPPQLGKEPINRNGELEFENEKINVGIDVFIETERRLKAKRNENKA